MRYISKRTLGMAQVQLQRQGRDEQERQRGEQGQAVGGLDGLARGRRVPARPE